ncbi:PLP-dependent aminotransferase family protein [Comamonas sp. NoAH]|uniref:aminotransferase-like domain-containing protein n=1 Tax=Comamonas halotolerans TaxID=3041496 RepID=UPI0024E1189C|nr:PLP-dependent aminotransferase family protein [Comamonas sp. NoAH]
MAKNIQPVLAHSQPHNDLGWTPVRLAGAPSLAEQLVTHCQQLLSSHSLRAGTRMPSVRQLADSAGISRDTVVQAYDRLVAQGLLTSRPGAGFFVNAQRLPMGRSSTRQAPTLEPDAAFDTPFLLRSIFRQYSEVSFDGSTGMLPASWLDPDMLNAAVRSVGRSAGMQLLSYGTPQGYAPLRQQLAAHLMTQGLVIDPELELMTVTGVTHGMDLVLRSMLRPGDAVLVEDPAWFLMYGLLRSMGVHVLAVPRLRDGPDIQVLEQLAHAHQPKLFITNSVVHNPTGFGLSLPVAYDVLRLAEQHNFLILEDDTYADFVEHPTRLATLDRLRRVILVGGFSKTLAGSLRVGYIAAQPERIRALTDAKLLSGLTSPELGERVVHRILAEGQFRKHVQRLRERLDDTRHRCLRMVETLGWNVHQEPLAGMFVWVDTGQDTEMLARKVAAQGILLAPGVLFSPQQKISTMLRLPVAIVDESASQQLRKLI